MKNTKNENLFFKLNFKNEIQKKTSSALKSINESKTIKKNMLPSITQNNSYKELLVENKLINDGNFLVYLGKKYLNENSKDYQTYLGVIEECIDTFNKLHMEVDIQPRFISPALNYNKTLTENVKIDIYKKHFEESLTKKFSQPLLEGKLFTVYKDSTKLILENIMHADDSSLNIELFTKYAIFESCLFDTIKNTLVPDYNQNEINDFINKQNPEYFDMFDQDAQTLNNNLNGAIKKITIIIGPKMFNEAAGLNVATNDEDVDFKPAINLADDDNTEGTNNPEEDLLNSADNTGPLTPGKVIAINNDETQNSVTIIPDLDNTVTNEIGNVNDTGLDIQGLSPTDNYDNSQLEDDTGEQDIDPTLSYTEEPLNISTNDGNFSSAPEVEIDKPYVPADKAPEDLSVDFDSDYDMEVANISIDRVTDLEQEPEEYINIPITDSITEESTNLNNKNNKLDVTKYAGAMELIKKF